MQALIVEFLIKSEHVAAFDAAITDNARASREAEPGCRQFDVCRDPQDPKLFFCMSCTTMTRRLPHICSQRISRPWTLPPCLGSTASRYASTGAPLLEASTAGHLKPKRNSCVTVTSVAFDTHRY
jgi:hypothetical protein